MIKLYRSAVHPNHWVAYVPGTGWVMFPAKENGWANRCPARGLDPVHLRQVSLSQAAQTGILEPELSPELADVA